MISEFYKCAMSLRIKEIRIARGLSQALLAEKAGVSRSQLSEIETEAKPANTLRLNAIAVALGVSVEQLFSEGAKAQYIDELTRLVASLDESDQLTLVRLARALAAEN